MKRNCLILLIITKCLNLLSQADVSGIGGHTGSAGYYCGWNSGTLMPFNIEHQGNQRINFYTNGFMRMFIDAGLGTGNGGITGGRIAFGNNLPAGFLPQSRLHIHQTGGNPIITNSTYIRFTNNQTGLTSTDGFAIGNNSNAFLNGDVQLQQYEDAPLSIFLPNSGGALTNFFHIQNGNGFTGINNSSPIRQLDVNGKARIQDLLSNGPDAGIVTHFSDGTLQNILFTGNVNHYLSGNGTWVTLPTGGGGANICGTALVNNVMKFTGGNILCNTNITDLAPLNFVGINNTTPNDALDVANGDIDLNGIGNSYKINGQPFLWHKAVTTNLFVGVGAANGIPAGTTNRNTIIGGDAGFNSGTLANRVTNVGFEAGYNDNGAASAFYGWRAGYSNTNGDFNTFVGGQSGETNTTGAANAYFGGRSAQNNNGSNNTVVGFDAGLGLVNGSRNVIIGNNANTTSPNLSNGIAIGENAIVTNNNQMILGNNNVNVGIGLSANVAGPQNKLEINRTGAPNFLSGLRLSDLANAAPTIPNGQVLSVDPLTGDVILTTGPTGGAFPLSCAAGGSNINAHSLVNLNGNNLSFDGTGNIAFGDAQQCFLASLNLARVHVRNTFFFNSIPATAFRVDAQGGPPGTYAAEFFGDVVVNGAFVNNPSDANLKTNISNISNALGTIKQIQAKHFYFDTINHHGLKLSSKHQYGVIAQQVETVLPELISNITKSPQYDNAGNLQYPSYNYKTVNYDGFIGLLIKAVQEQQSTIDSLQKKDSIQSAQIAQILSAINSLSSTVESCCSNSNVRTTGISGNNINNLDIELSDKNVIVLNQNVPNPFAEQTTITYNVPEQYGFAQIIFKTLDGKIIKAVDINKKGKGQLNVFANDLSNGLYMYSLIVDGKVVDTKKMVKQ